MSNFPTAFWKKQPESISVAGDISITWETGLFWSRGNVGAGDINSPATPSSPVPPLLQSSFPFVVSVENTFLEYYSNYDDTISVGNDDGDLPYYGWYLTGGYDNEGENVLTGFHQSNSWIPLGNVGAGINNGDWTSGISLWNEADHWTALIIDENLTRQTYNAFVQSGSATGTFNVSSAQAAKGGTGVSLYTTVSGLGEDFVSDGQATHYNLVEFYLDSSKIGEGVAPQDGRNVLNLSENYDQQQLKFYLGSDTSHSNLLNPDPNDGELGAPRGYSSEDVEQTIRTKYCTTDGQHTFAYAMGTASEGSHQIKIYSSTVDGLFNSGAFCGFEFKLV